jgi:hypothetical protein
LYQIDDQKQDHRAKCGRYNSASESAFITITMAKVSPWASVMCTGYRVFCVEKNLEPA